MAYQPTEIPSTYQRLILRQAIYRYIIHILIVMLILLIIRIIVPTLFTISK